MISRLSRGPGPVRAAILVTVLCGLIHRDAMADPCGMVPPIYVEGDVPLERIGLQKTYVFYKDGIETFVIRPGFQGRVEEFGMLIPFPSPPALRKIPDDTFAHIAAAVDPPEVVVDLTPVPYNEMIATDSAVPMTSAESDEEGLSYRQVNVLKQEAVGMYEVAVLEAGSAAALNQWMTDHGYRYPEGMDGVCNDYVEDGWCFVAVKARVGQKDGVDPRPGMTATNADLPADATFDGHVQGMGFRFRSEELVVPMRLSAFNAGDLHNVVYLLTDGPMKARDLPAGHVVRQVAGVDLLKNVTEPLPLRIIGGTYRDIPEGRRQSLAVERNPAPHNGIAKDLFAGDLLTASGGQLSHAHEELEKELLDIGERLGLRGREIDALNDEVVTVTRQEDTAAAIRDLSSMTMTVIDGDFERAVIAADNVHFAKFEMNPNRNTPRRYNARLFGPSSEGVGLSDVGAATNELPAIAVSDPEHGRLILQQSDAAAARRFWLTVTGVVVTLAFLIVMVLRGRGRKTAGLILMCTVVAEGVAQDQQVSHDAAPQVSGILDEIGESSDRTAAISRIRSLGEEAVPALIKVVQTDSQIQRRGWAVICLKTIGGGKVANALDQVVADGSVPPLVRTWAAAARVEDAMHFEDVARFASLCSTMPALRRPLRMKIMRMAADESSEINTDELLRVAASDYQLQQTLAPVFLKLAPTELAKSLVASNGTNVRQQAAAWLATMKTHGVSGVNQAVTEVLTFRKNAEQPPWGQGPLFVPRENWDKSDAVALINELTLWFVWCESNQQTDQVLKITRSLNSWQLMHAAGFQQVPNSAEQWLTEWEKVIGGEALGVLMKRAGFRYAPATLEKIDE